MEVKGKNNVSFYDTEKKSTFHFSKDEQIECFKNLSKSLIKLLYMIEDEMKNGTPIDLWFYTFVYDLTTSNALCENKLTKVIVKIYGLYENNNYKKMTHDQIKRQIFESKGILDFLIKDLKKDIKKQSNNKNNLDLVENKKVLLATNK